MLYLQTMRVFAALNALFTTATQANAAGDWRKHVFDFNIPSVNFETEVPADSKVERVPMEHAEAGAIGKVKVIGKVTPGADG